MKPNLTEEQKFEITISVSGRIFGNPQKQQGYIPFVILTKSKTTIAGSIYVSKLLDSLNVSVLSQFS